MSDLPDLYADDITVTVHGQGVVLTIRRVEPAAQPGPAQDPPVACGRVRMTHATAMALAELIPKTMAQAKAANEPTKIKH